MTINVVVEVMSDIFCIGSNYASLERMERISTKRNGIVVAIVVETMAMVLIVTRVSGIVVMLFVAIAHSIYAFG